MIRIKPAANWLFKDLRMRKGEYVIGESPNLAIIVFALSICLAVAMYKGFWQHAFSIIAYAALTVWAIQEIRSGHSRFRKLLGGMAIAAVAGALLLRLGFA